MNELGTNVVFALIVAAALALMTYVLWHGAQALGHSPERVGRRLVILWLAVSAAVALGVFLRRVFPQGLFQINFTRVYETPWFLLSGKGAGLFLAGGLLGMALCAAIGLWAISSLQRPAPGLPPEPPEGNEGEQ